MGHHLKQPPFSFLCLIAWNADTPVIMFGAPVLPFQAWLNCSPWHEPFWWRRWWLHPDPGDNEVLCSRNLDIFVQTLMRLSEKCYNFEIALAAFLQLAGCCMTLRWWQSSTIEWCRVSSGPRISGTQEHQSRIQNADIVSNSIEICVFTETDR